MEPVVSIKLRSYHWYFFHQYPLILSFNKSYQLYHQNISSLNTHCNCLSSRTITSLLGYHDDFLNCDSCSLPLSSLLSKQNQSHLHNVSEVFSILHRLLIKISKQEIKLSYSIWPINFNNIYPNSPVYSSNSFMVKNQRH